MPLWRRPFAPDQSIATVAAKRPLTPTAAGCRRSATTFLSRGGTGGGGGIWSDLPLRQHPRGEVAPAEPEGDRGGDRGRAEDQPERHHHDLVGQPHEGQPDRGEQGDDGIFDDRLGIARLAGRAADQPGQDARQEQADDDDHRAEDDLAAKLGDLEQQAPRRCRRPIAAPPRSPRRAGSRSSRRCR